MIRIVLAIAVGVLIAGCVRSGDSRDGGGAEAVNALPAGELLGYYEVAHGRSVYVLGSMKSVDALRAGTLPSKTVRRFDREGRAILFESDGVVLEKRLMAEYERRHGWSE